MIAIARRCAPFAAKWFIVGYIVQAAVGFMIGLSLPWLHLFGVI